MSCILLGCSLQDCKPWIGPSVGLALNLSLGLQVRHGAGPRGRTAAVPVEPELLDSPPSQSDQGQPAAASTATQVSILSTLSDSGSCERVPHMLFNSRICMTFCLQKAEPPCCLTVELCFIFKLYQKVISPQLDRFAWCAFLAVVC